MQRIIKINIDCKSFEDVKTAHAVMRAAIGSDQYIGSNLDALHDTLTSICKKTRITVTDFGAAEEKLGEYAGKIAYVLAASASQNPALTVVFE